MADREKPLVSVIVRTKDRPGLLGKALKSIASQDYRPVEVILINDGGCDLDVETAKTILDNCLLKHIRFAESKGRAAAGNEGILQAGGRYIGFLDDDDELYPDHLSTLVACLRESGDGVVYGDSELVVKEVDAETADVEIRERKVFSSYDFSYTDLMVANYIPLISLLFSAEILKQSGGFDEGFNLYEDWDLLLRIGEKFPFRHVKKVTSIYNQWDSGSQIAQGAASDVIHNAFLRIFDKHRHNITPEVIVNLDGKQKWLAQELEKMTAKYISMEAELQKRYDELRQTDAELRQKRAEIQHKDEQLYRQATELTQKESELSHAAALLAEKVSEAERLSNANRAYAKAITEIQATFGWQSLNRLRRIRDTLLPPVSRRGKIYQKIISRMKGGGHAT